MNQAEFAAFMDRIYETEIKAVRADGQKEYAHEGESFDANFQRIGARLGMEPATVLYVYLSKHMDGIASFLKGHTSQREDVTGRIKDAITYLFLMWGIIHEQRLVRMIDADDEAFVAGIKGGHIDDPVVERSAADEIDDWVDDADRQVDRAGGLGMPMRWLFGHDGIGMGG
jgi:hypothetical protein